MICGRLLNEVYTPGQTQSPDGRKRLVQQPCILQPGHGGDHVRANAVVRVCIYCDETFEGRDRAKAAAAHEREFHSKPVVAEWGEQHPCVQCREMAEGPFPNTKAKRASFTTPEALLQHQRALHGHLRCPGVDGAGEPCTWRFWVGGHRSSHAAKVHGISMHKSRLVRSIRPRGEPTRTFGKDG